MKRRLAIGARLESPGIRAMSTNRPRATSEALPSFTCTACESLDCRTNEVFTAEFARHRLPVIAPITGQSWWTDRICPEFDPQLTAERHVLANVLPWIARTMGRRAAADRAARDKHGRPRGTAVGVQALLRCFPSSRPSRRRSIIRYASTKGIEVLWRDVRRPREHPPGHGHAARPSAELAAEHLVLVRPGRLRGGTRAPTVCE